MLYFWVIVDNSFPSVKVALRKRPGESSAAANIQHTLGLFFLGFFYLRILTPTDLLYPRRPRKIPPSLMYEGESAASLLSGDHEVSLPSPPSPLPSSSSHSLLYFLPTSFSSSSPVCLSVCLSPSLVPCLTSFFLPPLLPQSPLSNRWVPRTNYRRLSQGALGV